ncbi:MAG: ATP-binding protein [Gammaproteobacteria bacterium]|nr:ATP-binding protein [Gammaproteobacteria bacterium]
MNKLPVWKFALITSLLALLSVGGNFFGIPVFFGVDFIFGSVAAILALVFLGLVPALFVSLCGGLYTLVLWGHPYAMIIFALEIIIISALYKRGTRNLVLADLLFWLTAGAWLVLIFYRGAIGVSWDAAILIAVKQPLNGIFNTLIAGLIVHSLQVSPRFFKLIKLGKPTLSSLLFHALLTTILIAGMLPILNEGYNQRRIQELFLLERMQDQAKQIRSTLKQSTTLSNLKFQLDESDSDGIAILDAAGNTIFRIGVIASLEDQSGDIETLGDGFEIWLPIGEVAVMKRWKQSRYRLRQRVDSIEGISAIVIEREAKPLVQALENGRLRLFIMLAALLLVGIIVARGLSNWLTRPLSALDKASGDLSGQISQGARPDLPESVVKEYDNLSITLRDMADQLGSSFTELNQVKDDLEKTVETRTHELRESQERWQFALEGAGDGVWDWNVATGSVFFSRRWKSMLGYADDEVSENIKEWNIRVHPEDKDKTIADLNRHMNDEIDYYENEHRMRCKDGTYKWILDRGKVVERDKEGRPSRVIGTHTDISERKKNEERLMAAMNAAEKASHAKSEFLSSMSHELRTPLNAIIGFSQLIGLDAEDAVVKSNSAEIYNAGKHLLELINDILDLSKIDSGAIGLSCESVELGKLVSECVMLMGAQAGKQHIEIRNMIDEHGSYRIHADYTRFKQVLLNLLSNAIKYNCDGGSVVIDCERSSDDRIALSITDTGVGMSDEQLQNLFMPFERLGAEKTGVEGTGIGLLISKRLMELMDGSISVSSEVKAGTIFTISIGLSKNEVVEKISDIGVDDDRRNVIPGSEASDRLVLYIEDNPANLQLVAQIFSSLTSYQLIYATNAVDGIALAKSRLPDLILMDINMPGMDGYEALAMLKADKLTKHIPVAAVSGNAMQSDIRKGLKAGFELYLTKPFQIGDLVDKLHFLLSNAPPIERSGTSS